MVLVAGCACVGTKMYICPTNCQKNSNRIQMLQWSRQIVGAALICWEEWVPCKVTATDIKTLEGTPVMR